MSAPVLVFVNDQAVRVAPGVPAVEAVAAHDPGLAEQLRAGSAYLTDGRGIRLDAAVPVFPGAIFRVVRSARAVTDEADAHA
ncbi:MAG TPA: hypothetical protein VGQ73_03500 [Gemmatimonadales bacterium]|nr:hypothetical protein [Gemmatimonadales bacterium]